MSDLIEVTPTATTNTVTRPLQLKGSLFAITVVQLFTNNYTDIKNHLLQLAKQLPNFFKQTPVVIDLQKLPETLELDFIALKQLLREVNMLPVGVRCLQPHWQQQIIAAELAIITVGRDLDTEIKPKTLEKNAITTTNNDNTFSSNTKIITQTVRSGQQIYAKQGDLIILGSVSHGAEILADGNIHVYGALRGRALAGTHGDENARIFCAQLDAELISIAGIYLVKENIQIPDVSTMYHIYLDGEELQISHI